MSKVVVLWGTWTLVFLRFSCHPREENPISDWRNVIEIFMEKPKSFVLDPISQIYKGAMN